MKTKRTFLIKSILFSILIIIQINQSLASSYVWVALNNPDTLSVNNKSFSTDIMISAWNGNPGAYDISITYNQNILKIDSILISEESPIYMNCSIDTTISGSLRMTGYNLDENNSWDAIQIIASISWQVVSASGVSTEIDLKVNDLVESTWKPVEVYSFGQHIELNPTNTEYIPTTYELGYNYPNPFRHNTIIKYYVSKKTNVTLSVYDISGKLITILVNEVKPNGNYKATWDGKDSNGTTVKTGVYFYKMRAGTIIKTNKMLFLK